MSVLQSAISRRSLLGGGLAGGFLLAFHVPTYGASEPASGGIAKLVWNSLGPDSAGFPSSQTRRNWPAPMIVPGGNAHCVRFE